MSEPYMIPVADNSMAPANAVQDLGNAFFQAAQEKRPQQEFAAQQLLRQRAADEETQRHQAQMEEHQRQLHGKALEEALQNKDNPDMLRMISQKYGLPFADATAPQAGASQAPPQALGVSPGAPPPAMPVQPQAAPMAPPQEPMPDSSVEPMPTVKVHEPITITADAQPAGEQEHLDYTHQLLTQEERVKQQADRVEQFQQAEQAVRSGAVPSAPSPRYQMGPFTIDTGALKAHEETSKAERVKKYQAIFADNPEALKIAIPYAHLGLSDEYIAKAIESRGLVNERMEGRMGLLEKQIAGRQSLEDDKQAAGIYASRTGAAGGATVDANGNPVFNAKIESANRMALKNFQTQTTRWAQQYGIPQIAKGVSGLDETEGMLRSGNPTAGAAALERFVAVSRSGTGNGAAATQAALSLFQKHLGGIADSAEGAIEKLKSGKLGEGQMANLLGAVRAAKDALKSSIKPLHQSYVDAWYNEGGENIKGNVEDQEESLFGAMGYHPERDPNAKRIRPMSGQLPSANTNRPSGPQGASGSANGGPAPAGKGISATEMGAYQRAQKVAKDANTPPGERAAAQRFMDDIDARIQRGL